MSAQPIRSNLANNPHMWMEEKQTEFNHLVEEAATLAYDTGKTQRIMDFWGRLSIVEATPNFSGLSRGIVYPDRRFEWG